MKKIIFFLLPFMVSMSWLTGDETTKNNRYSGILSAQVGFTPYTATDQPFDRFPHLGISFETPLTDNIGVGGAVLYSRWHDYLGMFGGKYSFQVIKPSLDFIYHISLFDRGRWDLFGGASLSYNLVKVDNELGNEYLGDLKNHFSLSPFAGIRCFLFQKAENFLSGMAVSARIFWTVNGDFSGVYGLAGFSYGFGRVTR